MRPRGIAVSAATLIAAASMTPFTAQAATGSSSTLVPGLSVTADGPGGVVVSDAGTTDSVAIIEVTYDFGDGSPKVTVSDGTSYTYQYARAGTYQITETVGDADGNTATKTASFSTDLPPWGTLVGFQQPSATSPSAALDSPPDAANIAQASVAALPNGTSVVAAATTAGAVELDTRTTTGSWRGWLTLNQPGVKATWVSIAGMPNGSLQLIEVTSALTVEHIVRNPNGTWQSGWGTPAGSSHIDRAAITAMPDGSSQLVAVTSGGVLEHDIRYANGSWQGWRPVSQPGVWVDEASIAGMPDGSSQLVEIVRGGMLMHDIRYANGSWQASGWGQPTRFAYGSQVSITALPSGASEVVAATGGGEGPLQYLVRNANGSWTGVGEFDTDKVAGASSGALVALHNGSVQVVAVSFGST